MARKKQPARGSGALSMRQVRAGELIRQELSQLLESSLVKDPRVREAMTTVTDVRVSPDLAYARVYLTIFSDDREIQKRVLDGIRSASGVLRHALGRAIQMRITPELSFELDESVERGARVEAVLREIREESAPPSEPEDQGEDP